MSGQKAGQWFDHEAGQGGGPLKLISRVNGCTPPQARKWAEEWLGDAATPHRRPERAAGTRNLAEIEEGRRRASIAAAGALWNGAGHIGAAGAAYLAGRGLPASWSPSAVRELPASPYPSNGPKVPALVFKAQAAVQLVLIDPATARKAPVGPNGAAKVSRGRPSDGGCVIQAGQPGAPTLIAEGPENALTAAYAKPDWRVIVTFSVANLDKQGDLLGSGEVVLLSDNNAADSQATARLHKSAAVYQAQGRRVRIAHPPTTPEKPDADLNDALQLLGLDAVQAALDSAPIIMPPNGPKPIERQPEAERQAGIQQHRAGIMAWAVAAAPIALARAEFRRRQRQAHYEIEADLEIDPEQIPTAKRRATIALKDELGRELLDGEAPRLVEASPAGIGKTTTALQVIKETGADKALVHVYAPTLQLAAEAAQKAAEIGLDAVTVRGRTAPVGRSDKERMCERWRLVEKAQAAGVTDIQQTLCKSEDRVCPHFDTCRYQKQREELSNRRSGIVFLPHSYLTISVPFLEAPDLVVIDESHHDQFAGHVRLDPQDIADASTNWQQAGIARAADWSALSGRLLQAFKGKAPLLAELRRLGVDAAMLQAGREYLAEVEDEMAAAITPDMDAATIERKLQEFRAGTLHKVKLLVRAIEAEIELPRDTCNGVVAVEIAGKARLYVHYRKESTAPDAAPLLILDASEDPIITRAIWGEVPRQAVAIERRARVTQIIGRQMSKATLTGKRSTRPGQSIDDARDLSGSRALEAEQITADIAARVVAMPGRVLAVGQKDVVAVMNFRRPKGQPPVIKAHFNALRGLDGFKDYDGVAVIGRLLPPAWAMEATARSLWATDPEPIETAEAFTYRPTTIATRDGGKATVKEPAHPDARVTAILHQSLKAELLQAIDRLRLIHTDREKAVLVVNEVSLPGLVVDRVEQFRLWRQGGSRIERALRSLDVIPLQAGKMTELHRHIWESERTAKRDLAALNAAADACFDLDQGVKHPDNGAKSLEINTMGFGPIISGLLSEQFQMVSYRVPGQRGKDSRALVRLGVQDVPALLAAHVGPLAAIRLPDGPAIEIEADMPPAVSADLAERIALMVIDGGMTEAQALAELRGEARAMSP